MGETSFDRQRLSFGAVAGSYDRVRPSYPAEAVRWALGSEPLRVVELGAGTGLLTRVLVGLGHRVTAVEPDPQMRGLLAAEGSAGCAVVDGSAERIPVEDGVADAVVAGQSYHWFSKEAAHPEIARVLRPGGVVAPLWNLRDESVAWVARLSVLAGVERDGSRVGVVLPEDEFGDDFGPLERAEFRFRQPHNADSLLELVMSRSWYLTASERRQREISEGVRELAAGLPEVFDLPYVTRVYRAARR